MSSIETYISSSGTEENHLQASTPDDTESELEKYAAKLKLFGADAERVSRSEFDQVVEEVIELSKKYFKKIVPAEQLNDKETFGDVDLITLIIEKGSKARFTEIFKDQLKGFSQNSNINSLLLKLAMGKTVHVDFIEADDDEDFDRKLMYYSKGHSSAMIGILAKKLNYKYGTEGFFKRYKDSKGNWHDISVTPKLQEGLEILGLSSETYKNCHNMDEIIAWLGTSPLFDSDYYGLRELATRDRQSISRNQSQKYMVDHLHSLGKHATVSDSNEFFVVNHPEKYQHFTETVQRLESELALKKAISGDVIIETFNLTPGKIVGQVIKFLKENYPNATELTPEMVETIKSTIL